MATKKLYSNASSTYYYLLESLFTEDSTNTANNTSTLTLTAHISNHDIRYTSDVNSTLKIYWYDNNLNANGTLVASLNVKSIYPSSASTVMTKTATGTVTVTHKDDGTLSGYAKAVWTKASGASNYCPNSGDVSTATTALTNIPRYAKITSFSVSKRDETSVTFNYATDVACDLAEYSKDNGSTWANLPNTAIVSGLSANTAYNFKLRVRRTDSQLKTTSDTVAQTTYPYPSLSSVPNFVIGNTLTIGINNPLSRSVTVKITANGTAESGSGNTTTGTSISGYVNSGYQNFWYSSLGTTAKTASYTATMTYGSVTSTKSATYSIDETACKPVINANSSTVRDVNTNITTLTLNASKIVKGFSTARLHVVTNKISNVYDTTATISYYKYVGDGSTWTSGDKDILKATTASYQVQIVNSRGIASDVVTLSATLHPYFNPTVANFKVVRPTQVGNEMKLSANGALFHDYFGTNNRNFNNTTIKWYVRTSAEDAWTLGGDITNDSSMSYTTTSWNFAQKLISNPLTTDHTWDYMTQYYFKIEIQDRLQTVNSTTYVSIGQAYYEWWRQGDTNFFKINGKSITTNLATFENGVNGKHLHSGGGTAGYMYAFYLEATGTYNNQYISFDVLQRTRISTIEIQLNNVNSTTIGVTAVNKSGLVDAYYIVEDNKFKFYIKKVSEWDYIEITNLQFGQYSAERTRITWVNQVVASLPNNVITVQTDTLKYGKSAITVALSTQTTLTVTSAYNYVKIPLDTVVTTKDNKGCFTLSNGTVTINRTGWYAISGTALVRSSNTTQTAILFASTTQGSAGETYVPIARQGAFTSIVLPPYVRKLYAGNVVVFDLSGSTTGDIIVAGSNRFTYMTIQEV